MTIDGLDIEWVRAEGERPRRWGRWGPEDDKGALNLLTQERILEAVATVRVGRVLSLAMPFGPGGPQPDEGRFNPKLTMVAWATRISLAASSTPTTRSLWRCRAPRSGTRSRTRSTTA